MIKQLQFFNTMAWLLKGLIAYPVDIYKFISIISQLFIDYILNILHF